MSALKSRAARRREKLRDEGMTLEFVIDKAVDFLLIFVGLYAATATQRWQDRQSEREEYVAMLGDFEVELATNLEQEASIIKDLGPLLLDQDPPELGDMRATFDAYFAELREDEEVLGCLHKEFTVENGLDASAKPTCHALYQTFLAHHQQPDANFDFRPVALTPFYRYEVWQMYLANGVRIFQNKELAVAIGEIYNNAKIIERQVAEIEALYNDQFMKQVGKTAATDLQLAELVEDEEAAQGLSSQHERILVRLEEHIKSEHYAVKEIKLVLEMKVERMKSTVLLMRAEIEAVDAEIDAELAAVAG